MNTNAWGAFLNGLLANAQRVCCSEIEDAFKLPLVADFDAEMIGIFQSERRLQRGGAKLRRLAIVDYDPESQ